MSWLALAVVAVGCGGEEPLTPPDDEEDNVPPPPACAEGERRDLNGECRPDAIAPTFDCEPGSYPLADGTCRAAGLEPADCASGFVHDGDRSCEPTLPPERCAPGMIATVGMASCELVADCGRGPWGNIPVDADTQYVDAAYAVGDSDGTAAKPWIDIASAIAAAQAGAVVAIAAGSYDGSLYVSSKPVKLWGRCPSMVEISSSSIQTTLRFSQSSGAEVHQVAVTGSNRGIGVSGSTGVLIDRVWVHGYGEDGVEVSESGGAVIRDSLLEANRRNLSALGDVRIEGSLLRQAVDSGVTIAAGLAVMGRAELIGSVIEDNERLGAMVVGGELTVQGSVLRGTTLGAGFTGGTTIEVTRFDGVAGQLQMSGALVEPGRGPGVVLSGSEGQIETTVFRDGVDDFSPAILAQPDGDLPSSLSVRHGSIMRTGTGGIGIINSQALLEGVAIADVAIDASGFGGRAVEATSLTPTAPPVELTLEGGMLTGGGDVGIYLMGGAASIAHTLVQDVPGNAQGLYGRGVQVERDHATFAPSAFTLRQSRITRVAEWGLLAIGSTATIDDVEIDTVVSNSQGLYGDALAVMSDQTTASAELSSSRLVDASRAGVAAFGAEVAVASSLLGCHGFDLDGEPLAGLPFAFEDQGGMWCGCGDELTTCKVATAGVAPPTPLP